MASSILPTRRLLIHRCRDGFSEVLRTISVYLGVAGLAMVFIVLTVPALRQQVSIAHDAMLMALMPDGVDTPLFGDAFLLGMRPDVRPVEIGEVPSRRLSSIDSSSSSSQERTEQVGLLGNVPVVKIQAAMQKLDITEPQLKALEHYISRKYRVSKQVVDRIVESSVVVGADLKLNPVLVLAVMSVESRFNPYAESGAGAQGLMQVMTSVHTDKFERLGQDQLGAFHPEVNIRVGAQILADCIRRRGSEVAGLKCYVGATGIDDGGYSNKVQSEQRRMALAAKIPLK